MTSVCRSTSAWILCALLGGFALLSVHSGWHKSATADEPIYLAAGLRILQTGDLSTNRISSPYLLKPWLAAPLAYGAGETYPDDDRRFENERLLDHWQAGWDYLHSEGWSAMARLRAARAMNAALAVATAVLVFLLGRRLRGAAAGLCAVLLYVTTPEVIAHSHFASLDTGLVFLSTLTLWLALPLADGSSCSAVRAALAGFALGATFLAKTAAITLALYFGLWMVGCGVIALVHRRRSGATTDRAPSFARAIRWALVLTIALLTIHAGFGFEGTGDPVTDNPHFAPLEERFEGFPAPLNSVALWSTRNLPAPLPTPYLDLLAAQIGISAEGKNVFFHGENQQGGWRWFLFAVFLLKLPSVHLVLFGAGLVFAVLMRESRRSWLFLLGFVALHALFLGLPDRHGLVRYFLSIVPLLSVMGGAVLAAMWGWRRRDPECAVGASRKPDSLRQRSSVVTPGRAIASAAIAYCITIAVWAHPHHLAFLNEWLGGPWRAHEWYADSNCDWGQDLPLAAEYAREQGHDELALAYFGSGRPSDFGLHPIAFPAIGMEPPPGQPWWYEVERPALPDPLPDVPLYISVTLLRGLFLDDVYGPLLRDRQPDAMAAPSIAVFLPPHWR